MRLLYDEANQNNNILIGFYPLDGNVGYGVRKITFNGALKYEDLDVTLIPPGINWMRHKNIIDNPWKIPTKSSDYPICYSGTDIWFLVCIVNANLTITIDGIRKVTVTGISNITDSINRNTMMIEKNNTKHYFDIRYEDTHNNINDELSYNSIGTARSHTKLNDISWYDQNYMYDKSNHLSSTFIAVVNNADANHQLSFAYIVHETSSSTTMLPDEWLYHVETNENNDGINGGYIRGDIDHRMYTTIDPSGYTDGGSVYSTRRHIFASSTRLMDIVDNPLAVLKYFRANDKTHYSILPTANKTPIFTINASIEIDTEKYGNVIATDYNSVLRLYYIYTDSHIGTYLISARRLTWAASSIMTQIKDIWSFSDITVIDGQAKEFVNGIMTTTAMNGPTFDRLFAEIDDLRKRIAALESK